MIAHEFAHLRGLRHRDFHPDIMHYTDAARALFAWADDDTYELPLLAAIPRRRRRRTRRQR